MSKKEVTMKKTIIALLTAVILAGALSGCLQNPVIPSGYYELTAQHDTQRDPSDFYFYVPKSWDHDEKMEPVYNGRVVSAVSPQHGINVVVGRYDFDSAILSAMNDGLITGERPGVLVYWEDYYKKKLDDLHDKFEIIKETKSLLMTDRDRPAVRVVYSAEFEGKTYIFELYMLFKNPGEARNVHMIQFCSPESHYSPKLEEEFYKMANAFRFPGDTNN